MLGTFKGAAPKLTAFDMISFVANKGTGFSIDTAILTMDALKGAITTPINTGALTIGAAAQVSIVTDLTSSLLMWKDGIDSKSCLDSTVGGHLMTGYSFIRNINGGGGTVGIDGSNKQMKESFELFGSKDAKSGIAIDGAVISNVKPVYKSHEEMINVVWDNNGFDKTKDALVDSCANVNPKLDGDGNKVPNEMTATFDVLQLKSALEGLSNGFTTSATVKINTYQIVGSKEITFEGGFLKFDSGTGTTLGGLIAVLEEIAAADPNSVSITEPTFRTLGQALAKGDFSKTTLKAHLTALDIEKGYVDQTSIVKDPAQLGQTTKVPMRICGKGDAKSKITVKQILTSDTGDNFEIKKNKDANDTSFKQNVSMDEFFNSLAVADSSFNLSSNSEEARKVFFIGLLFGDDADKQSRICSINLVPDFNVTMSSGAQTVKGFAFSAVDVRFNGPILHMVQDFFTDCTMSITHPNYIPVDAEYGVENEKSAIVRGDSINTTMQKVLTTKHDAKIDDSLEPINKACGSEKVLSTKQAKALSSDTFGNGWFSKNGSLSVNFTLSAPIFSFVKGFSIKAQMIGSKMLFGTGILSTYQGIELI